MSLKATFILFYVLFISIFSFITLQMGLDVLGVDTNQLFSITANIPDPNLNPIGAFFQLLTNTVFFTLQLFYLLIIINVTIPEFLFLNIIFIVPFSVVMVYILLEFARGIG